MDRKQSILLLVGGIFLSMIAVAVLLVDGIFWPWAFIAGPVLVIIGGISLRDLRGIPDGPLETILVDTKTFLIPTDMFPDRLKVLAEKYPTFFQDPLLSILQQKHGELSLEEEFSHTLTPPDETDDKYLAIRLKKFNSGKTSIYFEGHPDYFQVFS